MAQWLRALTTLKEDLTLPVTLVLDLTPPSGFCRRLYIHNAQVYALKIKTHRSGSLKCIESQISMLKG